MDHITSIEIGAGLLAVWLATLFVLWRLIDRPGKPGLVKAAVAKEGMMLVHIMLLIVGAAMIIRGLNVFG